MAVSYSLYGVEIDPVGATGATEVGGIRTQRGQSGAQEIQQGGSGSIYPTFGGLLQNDPRFTVATVCVADIIDLLGLLGHAPTSCKLGFQKNTLIGGRDSTYLSVVPYASLWVPRTLQVEQDGEAEITYECIAVGDASNAPLSTNTNSLTFTQAVGEKFTLGPQSINSTAYEAQRMTIDFGLRVETLRRDGLAWATGAKIVEMKPTITVESFDLPKLSNFASSSIIGLAVTNWTGFLRKLSESAGSGRVADATEEHIKFQTTAGAAFFEEVGGGHAANSMLRITHKPVYDGSNAIIQVDTTAAIS